MLINFKGALKRLAVIRRAMLLFVTIGTQKKDRLRDGVRAEEGKEGGRTGCILL